MSTPSVAQLKRALAIKEKIESLENEFAGIFGIQPRRGPGRPKGSSKRKGMSAVGRKAIAAAQKRRWAKLKGEEKPVKRGRKKMSAAGRAKIAAAAKARWAKVKAAGKKSL